MKSPKAKGAKWYQLIAVGLTQWSHARCLEHIPALLRGCAALDSRLTVNTQDYRILYKLMKPMQLERYILTSYGFEEGRTFQNNTVCALVELTSHGNPSIETICEDYKCSPLTVERLIATMPEWAWIKANSPKRLMPKPQAEEVLNLIGVNDKW